MGVNFFGEGVSPMCCVNEAAFPRTQFWFSLLVSVYVGTGMGSL